MTMTATCPFVDGEHVGLALERVGMMLPGSALREAIASQSEGFVRRVGGLAGALATLAGAGKAKMQGGVVRRL